MYVDLGEDYFDKQKEQSIVRHSLRRLESLGYTVSLSEPEASWSSPLSFNNTNETDALVFKKLNEQRFI